MLTVRDQERRQALIDTYIRLHPHKLGRDEVVLKDYLYSVWVLIAQYRAGGSIEYVMEGYNLPRVAVEAALAYYEKYTAIIDNIIEANSGNPITDL